MNLNSLRENIAKKGVLNWLPSYILNGMSLKEPIDNSKPIHIMFCFVDHFEPFNGGADFAKATYRVNEWADKYPKMADQHVDADGIHPQHTWFYPPHYDQCFLRDLVDLCIRGYGDVEMHLHHNHMEPFPDTSVTLKDKILRCMDDYSKYGIFCLPNGKRTFAFIHGDWSLDNARGSQFCGVNDEITILKECGCYADFTFPSLGAAQPGTINRIYYCKDDPERPKSYNRGKVLKVGGAPWGDMLMIQGIVGLRWKSRTHRFRPSIETSNIDQKDFPFPAKIDYWVEHSVRIPGKPNWFFIKLHTHGGRDVDFDCLFGSRAHQMYQHLETHYNDKNKYYMHYVTSREMYNIIKAAEAGIDQNPGQLRDFIIPPYAYHM